MQSLFNYFPNAKLRTLIIHVLLSNSDLSIVAQGVPRLLPHISNHVSSFPTETNQPDEQDIQ